MSAALRITGSKAAFKDTRRNELRRLVDCRDVQRRAFLRWLVTSPALASLGLSELGIEDALAQDPARPGLDALVSTAHEALDVFDFQRVAEQKLAPAHWGYIATGVDGEETQRRNRAALESIHLRARRLVNVSTLNTKITLFGREWPTPLIISPCGSQRAFHPDGELATARAARVRNQIQALSTLSSTALEQVNEVRGEPLWFQLYAWPNWEGTAALVSRTRAAGCPVIVLTVDVGGHSNRVTLERYRRIDQRNCENCHVRGGAADPVKPMHRRLSQAAPDGSAGLSMTWDYIHRLRDITDQKLIVKGLMTREDALLAVEHGVDAIWVSNHGGRAEGSGRATINALPEIAQAIAGRIPIIVDGGFRRGTDLFKGIARGATAVAIGRPYLWGLAAFGQEGVERVLQILTAELEITMRAVGTPSLADIGPQTVGVE